MHDATPTETIDLYLDDRRGDISDATLASHRSRLSFWEQFCTEEGIESMQDVTGLTIHKYKTWRRSVNDINRVTLTNTTRHAPSLPQVLCTNRDC